MKKSDFSIHEAAKLAGMTSETLRHYDRIGLVKPSGRDPLTGYRRYSPVEIVHLQTVQALRRMDLSLAEIKTVLQYDDLEKIIDFLAQAEQRANAKILELRASQEKLRFVRMDYEKKLVERQTSPEFFTRELPQRTILLSDTMEHPTLDNLWSYLTPFYNQLDPSLRDQFAFEDRAGVYRSPEEERLFAVCARYADTPGLRSLPAGTYLCADCVEETLGDTRERLFRRAEEQYGIRPAFTLEMVVLSGILRWTYQLQLLIDKK